MELPDHPKSLSGRNIRIAPNPSPAGIEAPPPNPSPAGISAPPEGLAYQIRELQEVKQRQILNRPEAWPNS